MNTVVYIKQANEPPIPVTVRLEWLPNGKIKPIMYWTPDNSCYEVKHVYESTSLAFLREKGVGIRFRVRAEMREMPDNTSCARHETFLYLADMRFCESGFIDDRYSHPNKKYVTVTVDVFPNAEYELVRFCVGDECYVVERTLKVEPRALYRVGGIGVWHRVDVRANSGGEWQRKAVFWEVGGWYVA